MFILYLYAEQLCSGLRPLTLFYSFSVGTDESDVKSRKGVMPSQCKTTSRLHEKHTFLVNTKHLCNICTFLRRCTNDLCLLCYPEKLLHKVSQMFIGISGVLNNI